MRRTLWSRSLGAVLALWLALVLGDAGLVHACPMHAPPTAGAQTAAHGSVAGHDHHSDPAPDAPQDHSCTCPGDCTAAGAVGMLPTDEPRPVTVALVASDVVQPADVHVLPRQAAPRLLPFANGPPRV